MAAACGAVAWSPIRGTFLMISRFLSVLVCLLQSFYLCVLPLSNTLFFAFVVSNCCVTFCLIAPSYTVSRPASPTQHAAATPAGLALTGTPAHRPMERLQMHGPRKRRTRRQGTHNSLGRCGGCAAGHYDALCASCPRVVHLPSRQ